MTPYQTAFLAAYKQSCNVAGAAKASKTARSSHYEWLQNDAEYAEAFREAKEEAIDHLEAEARRRAIEGEEEPVIFKGRRQYTWVEDPQGNRKLAPLTVNRKSDTLLIFLLKGALPEKYAAFKGEVTHKTVRSKVDLSKLTDDELKYLRDLSARITRSGDAEQGPAQDQEVLPGDGASPEGVIPEEPGIL